MERIGDFLLYKECWVTSAVTESDTGLAVGPKAYSTSRVNNGRDIERASISGAAIGTHVVENQSTILNA